MEQDLRQAKTQWEIKHHSLRTIFTSWPRAKMTVMKRMMLMLVMAISRSSAPSLSGEDLELMHASKEICIASNFQLCQTTQGLTANGATR